MYPPPAPSSTASYTTLSPSPSAGAVIAPSSPPFPLAGKLTQDGYSILAEAHNRDLRFVVDTFAWQIACASHVASACELRVGSGHQACVCGPPVNSNLP